MDLEAITNPCTSTAIINQSTNDIITDLPVKKKPFISRLSVQAANRARLRSKERTKTRISLLKAHSDWLEHKKDWSETAGCKVTDEEFAMHLLRLHKSCYICKDNREKYEPKRNAATTPTLTTTRPNTRKNNNSAIAKQTIKTAAKKPVKSTSKANVKTKAKRVSKRNKPTPKAIGGLPVMMMSDDQTFTSQLKQSSDASKPAPIMLMLKKSSTASTSSAIYNETLNQPEQLEMQMPNKTTVSAKKSSGVRNFSGSMQELTNDVEMTDYNSENSNTNNTVLSIGNAAVEMNSNSIQHETTLLMNNNNQINNSQNCPSSQVTIEQNKIVVVTDHNTSTKDYTDSQLNTNESNTDFLGQPRLVLSNGAIIKDFSAMQNPQEESPTHYFPEQQQQPFTVSTATNQEPLNEQPSIGLDFDDPDEAEEGPFICDICDMSLVDAYTWKIHRKSHNVRRKQTFKCEECGKSYAMKENYLGHMNWHRNEKPFVCETCGKAFYKRGSLTEHRKSHSGEKYQCEICEKFVSSKSGLASHLATHSSERPFLCDLCGMSFRQKCILNHHMNTHTNARPFACDECPKAFGTPAALRKHKISHTNEKRYECEECGKRFTNRHHIKRHRLIHTQSKPFICETCGKAFNQKSNLKVHVRSHLRRQNQKTNNNNNGGKKASEVEEYEEEYDEEYAYVEELHVYQ